MADKFDYKFKPSLRKKIKKKKEKLKSSMIQNFNHVDILIIKYFHFRAIIPEIYFYLI